VPKLQVRLGRKENATKARKASRRSRHAIRIPRPVPFRAQVALPVSYKGLRLEAELSLDLLVADAIIVELKSVQKTEPVFEAQLLSYLKLTGLRLGLLINFNVALIKHGITRIAL
jgi:GxxExxY protein